jgi:outer membrane protein assembly factor BamB
MKVQLIKTFIGLFVFTLLVSCGDDIVIKNSPGKLAPLKNNQIKVNLRQLQNIGKLEHTSDQGLQIASNNESIFLASNAFVYAFDKKTGKIIWRTTVYSDYRARKRIKEEKNAILNFLFSPNNSPSKGAYKVQITAGPSASDKFVVVGGMRGELTYLNTKTGKVIQTANLGSTIVAPPLIDIAKKQVLLKTIDSKIIAHSFKDNKRKWQHIQPTPPLSIKGTSPIVKYNDVYFSGFDNGRLVKLDVEGVLLDKRRIALPQGKTSLERIIDVDAKPIIQENNIFVVSYQGRAMSINLDNNKINWLIDFSSILGGDVIDDIFYLIDDDSIIHGLSTLSGTKFWRQEQLKFRIKTRPVNFKKMAVFGGVKGYLHWIQPKTGEIVGRIKVSNVAITKLSVIGDKLYILDANNTFFRAELL